MFFSLAWVVLAGLLVYQAMVRLNPRFGANNTPLGTYKPSFGPPENIQELISRLQSFEVGLDHVDRRLRNQIMTEISGLQKAISSLSIEASNSATDSQHSASLISALRNQIDKLQKTNEKDTKMFEENIRELARRIDDVASSSELKGKIDDALQDTLPKLVVSLFGSGGSMQVPVETTRRFKDLLGKYIREYVDERLGGTSDHKVTDGPRWNTFLENNEEKLRSYMSAEMQKILKDGNLILPKEVILNMLRIEIERFQDTYERQKLYPEIESRLDTFAMDIDVAQSSLIPGIVSTARDAAVTAAVNLIEQHVGNAATLPTISPLGAQKPDYANQMTGGRVWPYLTSPSFDFRPKGKALSRLVRYFLSDHGPSPPPSVAISPTTDVGDCWPFPGSHGTLALRLSGYIHPTDVTIEHVATNVVHDSSTAPKTIEFWVQVRNQTERSKVENASLLYANATGGEDLYSRQIQAQPGRPGIMLDAKSVGFTFVKLHTFSYDLNGAISQSFKIPIDMSKLGVAVNIVAFVVRENYGNPRYTCLYRTRVHGSPAQIAG